MANMRQEKIIVGDVTLNVRLQGDKDRPLMLFLHGFPEHSGMWSKLMEAFSGSFFCAAPDQRGYAESSKPEGAENYTVPKLRDDIVGLIDILSPGRAIHLVGHDWGASVAYAVTMRRPDLVKELVIINGIHPAAFQHALLHDPDQAAGSQYFHKLRHPQAASKLAEDNYTLLFRFFGAFSDISWMTEGERQEYIRAWDQPGALQGMLNWYRSSPIYVPKPGEDTSSKRNPFDDTEKFRVRPRHLLIWGMNDAALRPSSFARLHEFCDDLSVTEIANGDHWVVNARPNEVIDAMTEFLSVG